MINTPPLAITYVSPGRLRVNKRNARTHSVRQIRQIADSIRQFGFLNPILVDADGKVIAGHGRLAAATTLGIERVPTVRIDSLDDAQKRAYVLADNRLAEKAGWDREILAIELAELAVLLPTFELDLTLTGFEPAEIDGILSDLAPPDLNDDEAVPKVSSELVTRPGDCWACGRNRLICGDARSTVDLDQLMAGRRASAMVADPPYNVRVVGHVRGRGRARHGEFAFASGEMTDQQFQEFLATSLANAVRVSKPGAVHYAFMDWRHIVPLMTAGHQIYEAVLNLCVWAKTNAGQGSFYRSQHELVAVFRVAGARHRNTIELGRFGRNRSNLWTYPGVNSFGAGRNEALLIHPTVKPTALVADAILDCTLRGEIVLDPFMGSGTTLLACEKVGRCAFGVEVDPAYVDVAVRRWQSATRQDAVLGGDGRTFTEIEAERTSPTGANIGAGQAVDTIVAGDAP